MKQNRRDFIKNSTKAVLAGLISTAFINNKAKAEEKNNIKIAQSSGSIPMRKLGRTGLNISVVGIGTSPVTENVVKYGLAQGVNFIHTSMNYSRGRVIEEVAKGIKGKRDKVIIGLKGTWRHTSDETFNQALRILGTDYIDILFWPIHNAKSVNDFGKKEAFERLKKQGKVRFVGLTSHSDIVNCMNEGIKAGWYDVLMPGYSLSQKNSFKNIFIECRKKNLGFVVMKSYIDERNTDRIQAMLAQPEITTITKSMSSLSLIRAFIEGAKKKISKSRIKEIIKEESLLAHGRCIMCGACTDACINNLSVNDIVRVVDYYTDRMNNIELAKETYRSISNVKNSLNCLDCGSCESVCNNNVAIRSLIKRAKDLYS